MQSRGSMENIQSTVKVELYELFSHVWIRFTWQHTLLKAKARLWSGPWRISGCESIPLLTLTAVLNLLESKVYLTLEPTFDICPTSTRLLNLVTGCTRGCYFYCSRKKFGKEAGIIRPAICFHHFVTATSPGSSWMVEVTIPTDNERAAAAGDECATWRYFDTKEPARKCHLFIYLPPTG